MSEVTSIFAMEEKRKGFYLAKITLEKERDALYMTITSSGSYGSKSGTCQLDLSQLKSISESINSYLSSVESFDKLQLPKTIG